MLNGSVKLMVARAFYWAYKSIVSMVKLDYMMVHMDGGFKPDQAVTKAEAVTMVAPYANRTRSNNTASIKAP